MSRTSTYKGKEKAKATMRRKQEIPRPANSFFIFRAAMSKQLQDEAQALGFSRTQSEMSKIIGLMWKNMPEPEKQPYAKLAQQAKEAHKKAYPDYRFQPLKRKRLAETESEFESEEYADSELDAECGEDYEDVHTEARFSIKREPSMGEPPWLHPPQTSCTYTPLGRSSRVSGRGKRVLDIKPPLPLKPPRKSRSSRFPHLQSSSTCDIKPEPTYLLEQHRNPWLLSGQDIFVPPYNAAFFDFVAYANGASTSWPTNNQPAFVVGSSSIGNARQSVSPCSSLGRTASSDSVLESGFTLSGPKPAIESSLLFAPLNESNYRNLMQHPDTDALAMLPPNAVWPSHFKIEA